MTKEGSVSEALVAFGEHARTGQRGDETLVRANVGGRFLAADVLLTRRKNECLTLTAFKIHSLSDVAASGRADRNFVVVVVADGKDTKAWASEVCSQGQVLTFGHEHVRAFLTKVNWSLECFLSQQHRIDDSDGFNIVSTDCVCQSVHVFEDTQRVDLGESDGTDARSGFEFGFEVFEINATSGAIDLIGFNFKACFNRQGLEHFQIGWIDAFAHESGGGVFHQALSAQERLEETGGAFVERSVHGFKARELRNQRLVDPESLQCALRSLGLIRSIGSGQSTDRADLTHDRFRFINRQTIRDEVGFRFIFSGELVDVSDEFFVAQGLREIQGTVKFLILADVSVEVFEV